MAGPRQVQEAVSSKAYPGLDKSPKENWVDKAGGLPSYIERIAKHLHYGKGRPVGTAIAMAVNTVKKWCSTGRNHNGGKLSAKTKATACKAVASWEKKKASTKLKETPEPVGDELAAELIALGQRRLTIVEGALINLAEPRTRGKAGLVAGARELMEARLDAPINLPLLGGPPADPREQREVAEALREEAAELRALVESLGGELTEAPDTDPVGDAQERVERARLRGPRDRPTGPHRATLQKGASGELVSKAQQRLGELGYEVKADGDFGARTEEAVKSFQGDHKLTVDGVIGPQTTMGLRGATPEDVQIRRAEAAAGDVSPSGGEPKGQGQDDTEAAQNGAGAASPTGDMVQGNGRPTNGGAFDWLTKGRGVGTDPDPKVKAVQQALLGMGTFIGDAGVDGEFGPETEKGVKRVQRRYGLKTDGIVGPKTWRLLERHGGKEVQEALMDFVGDLAAPKSGKDHDESKHPRGPGGRWIKKGSSGRIVNRIQDALGVSSDGQFGPETERAVREFQRANGLQVDGVVGRQTAQALLGHANADNVPIGRLTSKQWDALLTQVLAGTGDPSERKRRRSPESGVLVEARVSAAAKKLGWTAARVARIRRLPDGTFAPEGRGRILKPGDNVRVPHRSGRGSVRGVVEGDDRIRLLSGPDRNTEIPLRQRKSQGQASPALAGELPRGVVEGSWGVEYEDRTGQVQRREFDSEAARTAFVEDGLESGEISATRAWADPEPEGGLGMGSHPLSQGSGVPQPQANPFQLSPALEARREETLNELRSALVRARNPKVAPSTRKRLRTQFNKAVNAESAREGDEGWHQRQQALSRIMATNPDSVVATFTEQQLQQLAIMSPPGSTWTRHFLALRSHRELRDFEQRGRKRPGVAAVTKEGATSLLDDLYGKSDQPSAGQASPALPDREPHITDITSVDAPQSSGEVTLWNGTHVTRTSDGYRVVPPAGVGDQARARNQRYRDPEDALKAAQRYEREAAQRPAIFDTPRQRAERTEREDQQWADLARELQDEAARASTPEQRDRVERDIEDVAGDLLDLHMGRASVHTEDHLAALDDAKLALRHPDLSAEERQERRDELIAQAPLDYFSTPEGMAAAEEDWREGQLSPALDSPDTLRQLRQADTLMRTGTVELPRGTRVEQVGDGFRLWHDGGTLDLSGTPVGVAMMADTIDLAPPIVRADLDAAWERLTNPGSSEDDRGNARSMVEDLVGNPWVQIGPAGQASPALSEPPGSLDLDLHANTEGLTYDDIPEGTIIGLKDGRLYVLHNNTGGKFHVFKPVDENGNVLPTDPKTGKKVHTLFAQQAPAFIGGTAKGYGEADAPEDPQADALADALDDPPGPPEQAGDLYSVLAQSVEAAKQGTLPKTKKQIDAEAAQQAAATPAQPSAPAPASAENLQGMTPNDFVDWYLQPQLEAQTPGDHLSLPGGVSVVRTANAWMVSGDGQPQLHTDAAAAAQAAVEAGGSTDAPQAGMTLSATAQMLGPGWDASGVEDALGQLGEQGIDLDPSVESPQTLAAVIQAANLTPSAASAASDEQTQGVVEPPTPPPTNAPTTGVDLSDSPGRGPTGKLRNFKAMGLAKLQAVVAQLEAYGADHEALTAARAALANKQQLVESLDDATREALVGVLQDDS